MEKLEEYIKNENKMANSALETLQTSSSSSTLTTRRVHNNESVTWIWYDPKLENNEIETIEELRDINDDVVFYTDKEDCIDYIASIKNEKILLVITFEESTSIFLDRLQTFCSIDSIFILDLQSLKTNYQQENDHKIIDVFHDRQKLIESVRERVKLIENQWQTFSFYDQYSEKSTRDITEQFANFLWFQMFKDVVLQMPKDNDAKQHLIDFCRLYYHGNKKQLETIDCFEQTYPQTINAIQWYTKQSFVYKIINKALRTEDIELLYTLRFFISDLSSTLAVEYNQTMIGQLYDADELVLKLFRGCQLSNEEFERIRQNIGRLISINGFLSTSRSKDVALIYAGTSNNNTHQAVLFEIECNLNELNNSVIVADVQNYSSFSDEQEVLFDLGSTFQILSIEQDEISKIWYIKIKATDDGVRLTKEYIELNRKEINETSITSTFGNLLSSMGKLDQAQKYFENILSSNIQQQQHDVAQIYNSLGTIYFGKNEFDNARKNYQRAYDVMMQMNPPDIKNSTGPLNNIGGVMYQIKKYDRALEYYFKALEVDKQFSGEECLKVASTTHNIGLCYEEKEDFKSSLDYCKKALEIQRKLLPNDHITIAMSLNSIGTIYQRMKDYDEAFTYHKQALKMRQKILPVEHEDIAESFHNVAEVLHDQKQPDKALEYYFDAVRIREKIFDTSNGHTNLAMTLCNIGTAYEQLNDSILALTYYEKTLKMIPPDDHVEISKVKDYIARIIQGEKN